MKRSKLVRPLVILLIVLVNIGCDQVSKHVAREKISYDENINIVSHYFTLTKIENTGAFLSLGDSLPGVFRIILLNILPLLAVIGACVYVLIKTKMPKVQVLAVCFIIGGGLGNIYDRLLYGSVTDFMHMDFIIFQTGIFNMADVSVMVGMFMLIGYSLFNKPKAETAAQ